jgi:hypothetical protein
MTETRPRKLHEQLVADLEGMIVATQLAKAVNEHGIDEEHYDFIIEQYREMLKRAKSEFNN